MIRPFVVPDSLLRQSATFEPCSTKELQRLVEPADALQRREENGGGRVLDVVVVEVDVFQPGQCLVLWKAYLGPIDAWQTGGCRLVGARMQPGPRDGHGNRVIGL